MSAFSESDFHERERRLAEHLRRHDQVITTRQLAALGYDESGLRALVARARLVRVYRGVYRSGDAELLDRVAERAALAAVGPTGAFCLLTAAYRDDLIQYPPRAVQVAVPSAGGRVKRRRPGLEVCRLGALQPEDIHIVKGERNTTPERTILHLASEARHEGDVRVVRRALKQAAVRDHGLPDRLRDRLDAATNSSGAAILRPLLRPHLIDYADARSGWEDRFVEFLLANGLPEPKTNADVDGKIVDVNYELYNLLIELDTYGTHGGAMPFEDDRRLDTKLLRSRRRIMRVTEKRFDLEADDILDDVIDLLRQGGWNGEQRRAA